MTTTLPKGVLLALEQAKRTVGWNMRHGDVRRFILLNEHGRDACHLYVVPACRWVYRRWERRRAGWQRGNTA